MKKLCALRGATQVENTAEDIKIQLSLLYDELLKKNNMAEDDLVSIIFSVTGDITAQNPAAALRQSGRAAKTALFSALEPSIAPVHPRMIRVLIHAYLAPDAAPRHVYRNGAEILRPDLAS